MRRPPAEPLAVRLIGALLDLPHDRPAVQRFVIDHITDTLAVSIAAAATAEVGAAERATLRGSTGGACAVIGRDSTAPPAQAAFLNSALAHLLDFDDIHDTARLHPTTVTLPAALAAAELSGAGGPAVLAGVLLGSELMCRLGEAVAPTGSGPAAHWFLTQLFGYLGAAVAAGVTMGFDPADLVSAVGVASMQAAGSKQVAATPGSIARGIYPAFAAAGGVHAALLAAEGFGGPPDALDGKDGVLPAYLDIASIPATATDSRWRYLDTAIKPWPCCRISHPYVATAIELHDRLAPAGTALDPDRITRIRIEVNASAARLCAPAEARRRPATLADARYSVPFMTAHALRNGGVDLDRLRPDALHDQAVLALADKLAVLESRPDGVGHPPAVVEITTADGATLDATFDGTALDASTAQRHTKLAACLAAAGHRDSERAVRVLVENVRRLRLARVVRVADLAPPLGD